MGSSDHGFAVWSVSARFSEVAAGALSPSVLGVEPLKSDSPVWTVAQVAEYLRVSKATVYKVLGTKQLRGFRVGSDYRIMRERVEELTKPESEEPPDR